MGWYDVVSLLADSRIRFLMGFVIIAIVLAIILILVEILLKEKERRKDIQAEQTPNDRIKIYMDSNKSLQEKLAYLNKVAKEYFEDMYDISIDTSYSTLVKELGEKGKTAEVEFCKKMFEIFYSKKGLNKVTLNSLAKLLIEIEGHRTVERKVIKPKKKVKLGILSRGAEEALGIKGIREGKIIIKNPKKEIERRELKKVDESISKEDGKKLAAEEARTKKRLAILAKHDERQRQKEQQVVELKKKSESRIEERKTLVDERRAKRTETEEEKIKEDDLAVTEKQRRKDRKREEFWKVKQEKVNALKLREQEKNNIKKLLEERKAQILEEKAKLKKIDIEPVYSETTGMTKIEKNKIEKIDLETEGIAARIVRLEKERLEREGA